MNKGFDDIISKISECGMKTVAVAVAQDSAVLEAVQAAKERNIANAILVGDEAKIKEIAASGTFASLNARLITFTIAIFEKIASLPPFKITALPVLKQSAKASAVTFGLDS